MPSFDQTKANILKARTVGNLPPTQYQVPYQNIGDLLRRQVETHHDKPWLIFYSDETGRHEYSYNQFYELVCKTANYLSDKGITGGDRIATVAFNHTDTVVQYFAAWMIGAVVVPINVGEDDKRISFILHHSKTKLVFVREQFLHRLESILAETPSVITVVKVGNEHNLNIPEFHQSINRYSSTIENKF